MSYNGSVATYYRNGIQAGTATGYTFTSATSASARIGNREGSGSSAVQFNGTTDDLRIYNRALAPSEVEGLYKAGEAKFAKTPTDPLSNGLVGHWTFDGKDTVWTSATAATTLDKSGEGNTGTLTSMAQATAPTIGKIGQGLVFDGEDDYIDVGTASYSDLSEFTNSAWVYADETGVPSPVIIKAGTHAFQVIPTAGNNTLRYYNGNSNFDATSAVPDTTWTHVVAKKSAGNELTLYANGEVVLGPTSMTTSQPAIDYIGWYSTASHFWDGKLDDIRIYNRELAPSEITALYNAGEAKFAKTPTDALSDGLVGHWTFDGKDTVWTSATEATTLDKSGQGNTGTLTSMTQATAPAIGKIGQGLKFDGVDDVVITTFNILSVLNNGSFTIGLWANPNILNQGGFIYNGINSGATRFYLRQSVIGGGVILGLSSWNPTINSTATPNQWQYYTVVLDGTTGYIYRDGVLIGTQEGITVDFPNLPLKFGNDGTVLYFLGLVDDVRIYNRALSASEINQLYNMGR